MPQMKFVEIADFHKRARAGDRPSVVLRLAASGDALAATESRVATFVFSDNSVDRMGDTIDAKGWVLDKFMKNPVALFGHDSGSVENVVGRAKNVRVQGNSLIGDIAFMEASVNPTADAVYRHRTVVTVLAQQRPRLTCLTIAAGLTPRIAVVLPDALHRQNSRRVRTSDDPAHL